MIPNEKLQPNKYYAATTLINKGYIPWISAANTFQDILETEEGKKLYKPIQRKTKGGYNKNFIKGSVIIEILKKAEEGKLTI